MSQTFKSVLKVVVKLLLTGLALWFVLSKIDLNEIGDILLQINYVYFVLALLFFLISKVFAAIRLKIFFSQIGLYISNRYNFKLYLIGMFHNLYLPGGVGGDAFKIYLLNRASSKKVKNLIRVILFDRVNGLSALIFIALFLTLISSFRVIFNEFFWYFIVGITLLYPLYFLVFKKMFPRFHQAFFKITLLSFTTQIIQLFCTFFLLLSIGVEQNFLEYQALFMIASILTIVPITFGGVGIREMVFIAGYQALGLDKGFGVSFSILFFLLTSLVSLAGAFLNEKPKEADVSVTQL